MVTKSSFPIYTENSRFDTVLCNCGYCATNSKSGHPLYAFCICGNYFLVIGTLIGPHPSGGPLVDCFSGGVDGGVAGDSSGDCACGGDSLKRVLSR